MGDTIPNGSYALANCDNTSLLVFELAFLSWFVSVGKGIFRVSDHLFQGVPRSLVSADSSLDESDTSDGSSLVLYCADCSSSGALEFHLCSVNVASLKI